jgi:hypothetical protein
MSTTCRLGAVFRDAKVTREPPRDQYVQRVDFFPEVAAGVAGLTGRGANGGPGTFLICERGTGDIPHLRTGDRGHSSFAGRTGTFLITGETGDIPHLRGERGHSSLRGERGHSSLAAVVSRHLNVVAVCQLIQGCASIQAHAP